MMHLRSNQLRMGLLATLLLAWPWQATAQTVDIIEGKISGAFYAIHVPEPWNGSLVLFTHGYVDPALPVSMEYVETPTLVTVRDALTQFGFAFAYSSYRENGWAVADGVRRTRQLRGLFRAHAGPPERTYLLANSMGALVATKLLETHPAHYDGMLAVCGALGGATALLDYVADVRVLFDLFYPGVLPATLLETPSGLDVVEEVINPAIAAISGNPTGAILISQMDQTPVPWDPSMSETLVEATLQAVVSTYVANEDLLERTNRQSWFDNANVAYSSPMVPPDVVAWVNAAVARYDRGLFADVYLRENYQPRGTIEDPVITVHNLLDPAVPYVHEILFAETVAAAGNDDLLVQRVSVNPYGHCVFTGEELITAFFDLVTWAETGIPPPTP